MRSADATVVFVVTSTATRLRGALHTADGILGAHPGAEVRVAVVDLHDRPGSAATSKVPVARARVTIGPAALAASHRLVDGREPARLRMLHPASERAVLLLPRQLAAALAGGQATIAVAVPDDAVVVGALDDLIGALMIPGDGPSVVLSPIRTTKVPRDGRTPDDRVLVDLGAVEPGLLAVRGDAAGLAFLASWSELLDRHPLLDPDRLDPLVVPWLAAAAARASNVVAVVRRPVAVWAANADDPASDAAVVVRLPGFDPLRPWLVEPAMGEWPRVLASEHPVLRDAAAARAVALLRGTDESAPSAASDGADRLPSGMALTEVMRALYRDALHHAERHGGAEPPNPFVAGELTAALRWWSSPSAAGSAVSTYLRRLADSRDDLRAYDDGDLLSWARRYGVADGHPARLIGALLPEPALPEPDPSGAIASAAPAPASALTPGVSLVGLLRAEFGMGEAARQTLRAVSQAGVPVSVVTDTGATQRQQGDAGWTGPTGARHDVQVVVANADAVAGVVERLGLDCGLDCGKARGNGLHRVGVWFWEADRFPAERHLDGIAAVDEVWTASTFCRDTLAAALTPFGVEVHVMPWQPLKHDPTEADDPAPDRERAAHLAASLGIPPGRTCFLFSFDHRSVAERKNPWGVVEAFRRAFPRPRAGGPILAVKSISAELDSTGREHLRWVVAGRDDIVLIEETVDRAVMDALFARADAYVSLHRCEGYGLTMAEAMSAGTPVIATGWSGNMDFMSADTAWLVPFDLVEVPDGVPHYSGFGARWAEPHLGVAAAFLAEIADDPAAARAKAEQVAHDLRSAPQAGANDAAARFVLGRLRALRSGDPSRRRQR